MSPPLSDRTRSDWTLAETSAVTPGTLAFSVANYNDTEQNSSTHTATITVQRTGGTDGAVSVHYATSDGTATTANNDYDATSGDLNWADGDGTPKTFIVTVHGDTTAEAAETVNLTLSAATGGATIGGTNPATLTIVNDDTEVSVAVSPVAVLEDGATNLVYTFTRTGVTTGALTVNFAVSGTATFNTDYTQSGAATFNASSGTVNFGAGDTTKTVTIDPTADTTFEPNETVTLTVTSGTGYTVGSPSTATGAIINDDATLVVNITADTDDGSCTADPGGCTLREAINAANADIGTTHTINFDIPAADTQHFYYKDDGVANHVTYDPAHVLVTTAANDAGLPADKDPDWPHSWWSIRPASALPAITEQLMIDGYQQTGASKNTQVATDNAVIRIELNGVNAGPTVHGLTANALSTIQGLTINRFTGHGIALLSGSSSDFCSFSIVSGNFIGTDVSGTLAAANGLAGLFITNSTGQQVGCTVADERNIISGNTGEGVEILTSGGNFVQGNFIGVAANGTSLLGNGGHGVEIYASGSNNTIGVVPSIGVGIKIRPEGGSGSGCRASKAVSPATIKIVREWSCLRP